MLLLHYHYYYYFFHPASSLLEQLLLTFLRLVMVLVPHPPPLSSPKHNFCAVLAPECPSPFAQQVLTCGLHEGSGRFGVHPVARIRDGGVAAARE